jgi:ElaB/YqjD/DUF883 family membrane-anchored ribosome-binding protein
MLDEPEVIREQMAETRTALTDKLETLEQQVMDTVTETTSAVTDTVESVKEAVADTVTAVKDTVQDSVQAVKNTFDLPRQMNRHPWLFLGASVAVGYLGGRLLGRATAHNDSRQRSVPQARARPSQAPGRADTHQTSSEPEPSAAAPPPQPQGPGWLNTLGSHFGSEAARLKSLAIGAAVALARDSLVPSLPEDLRPKVTDVMNEFTAKLGGEVIHKPLFSQDSASGASKEESTTAPAARAMTRNGNAQRSR